jgi:hypothetical protein
MKAMLITIRRRGLPARRMVGIFAHTVDAVIQGLDVLGEQRGAVTVEVLK